MRISALRLGVVCAAGIVAAGALSVVRGRQAAHEAEEVALAARGATARRDASAMDPDRPIEPAAGVRVSVAPPERIAGARPGERPERTSIDASHPTRPDGNESPSLERASAKEARSSAADEGAPATAPLASDGSRSVVEVRESAEDLRGPTLTGTVRLAAGGTPVENAAVALIDGPDARAVTDRDGRFTLSCGTAGAVTVEVRGDSPPGAVRRRVRVEAGATTDAGDLLLEPYGRVEGTVRLASGGPAEGCRVRLRVHRGEVREARIGPDARFAFEALPAGEYVVEARLDRDIDAGVVVRPGATTEVTLGGIPQVTGVVRGALGGAPRDRSVAVVNAATFGRGGEGANLVRAFLRGGGQSVDTDQDGRFAVGGLAPGRWLLGRPWAYVEVMVGPPGEGTIDVRIEPCVIRARFAALPGEAIPADTVPTIRVVEVDLLERGLAGDGQALLLSLLGDDEDDLAGPGGAAYVVPRPGRYAPIGEGAWAPASPLVIGVTRAGPAEATIVVRPAPVEVTVLGLGVDEPGLIVVRDASEGAGLLVGVKVFSERGQVRAPARRLEVGVVRGDGRLHRFPALDASVTSTFELRIDDAVPLR